MMVLSEIGVNIGPLLAGAGIVGVAIGFGSQKLVQDLITGIFLLLENAMQVGDSVTVVGPVRHGGEPVGPHHPAARRRRLGAPHPVQLGDHGDQREPRAGQRSVNVSVAAHEDTDRVCDDAEGDRRRDARGAGFLGADAERPAALGRRQGGRRSVTIAGQVVCTDSGRWSVQREFNRRMKRRFEELGIQLYNPVRAHGRGAPDPSGECQSMKRLAASHRGGGVRLRARRRDARSVRPDGGLAGVRGELGRPWPRHLHGGWRALSEAPPRRVRRTRRRADPSQAAPAALPEPRLQPAERRHRALVRSGAAGDRRRRRA